jgi:large subunit ribosomal protein L22
MQFIAKASYIRYSPYKLRPLADVIRGKSASFALGWLTTYRNQRAEALKKLVESVVANAKNSKNVGIEELSVKEVRVDQGPIFRYFKPGAQGRAMPQRKRLSHISIIMESKNIANKEAARGTKG